MEKRSKVNVNLKTREEGKIKGESKKRSRQEIKYRGGRARHSIITGQCLLYGKVCTAHSAPRNVLLKPTTQRLIDPGGNTSTHSEHKAIHTVAVY